jgi:hypothetical protein
MLTLFFCARFEHAVLVSEHIDFGLGVRAILLRKQGGELGPNVCFLVQQCLDGRIQGPVVRMQPSFG